MTFLLIALITLVYFATTFLLACWLGRVIAHAAERYPLVDDWFGVDE